MGSKSTGIYPNFSGSGQPEKLENKTENQLNLNI